MLARKIGLTEGDWAAVESRRGTITLQVRVVRTIRPDTIFIPYHWAGKKSANQLTISAQDPISHIPEYKVCAVSLRKAEAPPVEDAPKWSIAYDRYPKPLFLCGSESLHWVQLVCPSLLGVRHA